MSCIQGTACPSQQTELIFFLFFFNNKCFFFFTSSVYQRCPLCQTFLFILIVSFCNIYLFGDNVQFFLFGSFFFFFFLITYFWGEGLLSLNCIQSFLLADGPCPCVDLEPRLENMEISSVTMQASAVVPPSGDTSQNPLSFFSIPVLANIQP